MSSQYYLMAQLPAFSIDQNGALPFTEDYFIELCSRFLPAKKIQILKNLSLEPSMNVKKTGSAFLDSWYDFERKLRIALAYLRAQKLKKDFVDENQILPTITPDVMQIARTAISFESPLEAEDYLDQARVQALVNYSPFDGFSEDAVFAYGIKFKLALRIKKFNEEAGMASYRKIYDQILGEST